MRPYQKSDGLYWSLNWNQMICTYGMCMNTLRPYVGEWNFKQTLTCTNYCKDENLHCASLWHTHHPQRYHNSNEIPKVSNCNDHPDYKYFSAHHQHWMENSAHDFSAIRRFLSPQILALTTMSPDPIPMGKKTELLNKSH